MKNKVFHFLFAFVLSSFISNQTLGQYYFYNDDYYDNAAIFEAGVSAGVINCLTDIGGHKGLGSKFIKDVNFGQSRINGSIYFGLLYKYSFGLRLEASFGRVEAADSVLKNIKGSLSDTRYDRNASFRSNISEISLIAEFYPTYIFRPFDPYETPPRTAPYLMVGIGLFHFNPQSFYKNEWVDLEPLHLEGQGFKEYPDRPNFKLTQINFPLGAGVKYEASPHLCIRAEFLYRILNTDYLDGMSRSYIDPKYYSEYLSGKQLELANALNFRGKEIGKDHDHNPGAPRGNPTNNDSYFTFNFKIGYILGRKKISY